ncbi:MarR family transcriptional regulator [uncultured Azohydromonas sp.]|jgi:Transcriptional regulators|uniref:MarR family winged helix-turn-helix transcriptional regulator n=1 Tax=uncultured Azohydromonas sp. TaxID=487342 RepID=UPI002605D171|nr:MarR family transcriptional regulator [uncultured Azohydromonas sp.]
MRTNDLMLRHLVLGMLRLSRAYRAAADEAASTFGLSHATAWPMVVIGRMPDGARPGAVAEAVEIEPSSLVRVIDQLVEAGLVAREEDPQDRRARILRLTPAGRECAQGLEEAMVLLRRRLFKTASKADIEATLRVFAALDAALADPARQDNPV